MPPAGPNGGRSGREVIRRAALMLGATGLVVALGALGLSRTGVGGAALGDLWARADLAGVLLGVLVITFAVPITAIRWRCLLPAPADREASIGVLTQFQCVAMLFNYALPGPAGELVAASLLRQRYGVPLADALVAGLVARFLGLAVGALIAGLLWAFVPMPVPEMWRTVLLAGVIGLVLGAGILGLSALRPESLLGALGRVTGPLRRLPGPLGRVAGRCGAAGTRLIEALAAVGSRGLRPLLFAACWTAVGHIVSPTGVVIAAWAMGIEVPWAGVVFTNAFVIVGALALFLFPGSQVGWDLFYCTVFTATTGASLPDAAAITVLARLQQSFVVLLGIFALLFLARRMVVGAPDER